MNRIQLTANFYLDEFVDPSTYFNEPDNGLSKIDIKVVNCVQLLREKLDKSVAVNNWWNYYKENVDKLTIEQIVKNIEKSTLSKWSGYRSPSCKIGAPASAHKLGKGADPKGNEKAMYDIVIANAKEFYDLGLRRIEDIKITKGWLHMDTNERNCIPNHINVVGLKTIVKRISI